LPALQVNDNTPRLANPALIDDFDDDQGMRSDKRLVTGTFAIRPRGAASMAVKRIRLELARDHEFPRGSSERGYEFAAPLNGAGHLVSEEWRKTPLLYLA